MHIMRYCHQGANPPRPLLSVMSIETVLYKGSSLIGKAFMHDCGESVIGTFEVNTFSISSTTVVRLS